MLILASIYLLAKALPDCDYAFLYHSILALLMVALVLFLVLLFIYLFESFTCFFSCMVYFFRISFH